MPLRHIRRFTALSLLACGVAGAGAQTTGDGYALTDWTGAAYSLAGPGYHREGERVYGRSDYLDAHIADVRLPRLDVADHSGDVFPHTGVYGHFAAELYATLSVERPGCYRFDLASDDGSILWLDDSLTVDNDGLHKYRRASAKRRLESRDYTAHVWYFDGAPPRRALELTVTHVPDDLACDRVVPVANTRHTLSAHSLFATGTADLAPRATAALDSLCLVLDGVQLRRLRVIGYTDGTGTQAINRSLSLRRAATVARHLRDCIDLTGVTVAVEGYGAFHPVASNATPEGRALNRRVEVLVD